MILVFIEHKDCVLNKTSLEAITAAQSIGKDLGLKVSAVIPCDKDCALAQEIAQYDLEKVIVAKNEKLGIYTPDGYADAWEEIIKKENPQYVVMAHTYQVRDFAPKVAARFGKEVVGDCIRYTNNGGKLTLTRRIFLGKLDADVTIGGDAPYFVTFQSGAFRGDNAEKGSAQTETIEVNVGEIRMQPEEPFQEAKASVDLSKSEIIVAVGRGIKSQENIAKAQELADALGADLAASRPICDAEWLPIDRQIGSVRSNRRAESLYRSRNFRRDPAHRRNEKRRNDRRHQQRCGSADFRHRRLRNRRRYFRRHAGFG